MKGTAISVTRKGAGCFGFIKTAEHQEVMFFSSDDMVSGSQICEGSAVTFTIGRLPDGKVKAVDVALSPEE